MTDRDAEWGKHDTTDDELVQYELKRFERTLTHAKENKEESPIDLTLEYFDDERVGYEFLIKALKLWPQYSEEFMSFALIYNVRAHDLDRFKLFVRNCCATSLQLDEENEEEDEDSNHKFQWLLEHLAMLME